MTDSPNNLVKGGIFVLPLLLISLFLPQLLLSDLIFARGDVYLYFYPYWAAAQAALLEGRIPLWNPDIFMGVPLLANSQAGVLYPLNWPLWGLFSIPYAFKASVVLHLLIAWWGTIALGRALFEGNTLAAAFAATLFVFGGYFLAQIEHINQIQGLAYLPWLLLVAGSPLRPTRKIGAVALLFSLQILAGHTQTVFISGVAVGIWVLSTLPVRRAAGQLFLIALASLLALGIVGAQLLPTLELIGLSARSGGLSVQEVLSFSWHPLLIPAATLPRVNQSVFTEYVVTLPLTVWVLAALAVVQGWKEPKQRPLLAFVLIGGLLALGRFGGVYWLLGRLPGFDLFRVPSRWLILLSLGVVLLAGHALLAEGKPARSNKLIALGLVGPVFLAQFGCQLGLGFAPVGPESPFELPSAASIALQLAEFGLIALWVWFDRRERWIPVLLACMVLWVAIRPLPVNQLTTRDAYFDLRPPSLKLDVLTAGEVLPSRVLSLSDIFFDPGDQAELDTIYQARLSEQAQRELNVAIKLKEIVAPNLSMVYGLPSVDGFDGGILPVNSYSELMADSILEGQTTTDGRLRERLPAVPDNETLSKYGVGSIITDKTADLWVDGVFFDRQHPQLLQLNDPLEIAHVPKFEADEIQILSDDPIIVEATTAAQTSVVIEAVAAQDGLWVAPLPEPADLVEIRLIGTQSDQMISAATLVNGETGRFLALTLGPYRLIHSGDVKLYENLNVWPRLGVWDEALGRITEDSFIEVDRISPEHLRVTLSPDEPAHLVWLEADYPGWQVYVDGRPEDKALFEGFFQGVELAAGMHVVEFVYEPRAWRFGRWLSLASLVVWLVLMGWPLRPGR